jgi:Asp-tRNA(Asn)/Glu-tRNA(Gln) amidotransferase A subunit family amidase
VTRSGRSTGTPTPVLRPRPESPNGQAEPSAILRRAHDIDALNPRLHAVITVDPRAVAGARAADRARRRGDRRPLLGIPVIVKDNVDTANMPTTAGSFALASHDPTRDAFIVTRLKHAGAIILGKANLSEWANFRSNHSSSGWSAVGGQTNNAYALNRNPCGSSSGSAVGSAADLAVAAVGTETDGSIVCPSGADGDVGIKPSLGLVSRSGIVPISGQQDTAGPIARNVTDAAVLLGVVSAYDPNDPITRAAVGKPGDYYVSPGRCAEGRADRDLAAGQLRHRPEDRRDDERGDPAPRRPRRDDRREHEHSLHRPGLRPRVHRAAL